MSLIIAGEKLKLYQWLCSCCERIGYEDAWRDRFWQDLLLCPGVYQEFLYYADHQDFLLKYQVGGNTVIDILVWEMRKYNIRTDRGKNGPDCDKEAMVMEAFRQMMDSVRHADDLNREMENRNGMDKL